MVLPSIKGFYPCFDDNREIDIIIIAIATRESKVDFGVDMRVVNIFLGGVFKLLN